MQRLFTLLTRGKLGFRVWCSIAAAAALACEFLGSLLASSSAVYSNSGCPSAAVAAAASLDTGQFVVTGRNLASQLSISL